MNCTFPSCQKEKQHLKEELEFSQDLGRQIADAYARRLKELCELTGKELSDTFTFSGESNEA